MKSIDFLKNSLRIDVVLRRKKLLKKRVIGVMLCGDFPHLAPLHNLVIDASPISRENMLRFFKGKKAVLVVLGGVFVQKNKETAPLQDDADTQLDLLVVGKNTKRSSLEPFIRRVEAEVGKELAWAYFTIPEFEYRRAMHDKFLRDLLDYEHELLINKLGVE